MMEKMSLQETKNKKPKFPWFALICCSLFEMLSIPRPRQVQEFYIVMCVILCFILFIVIAISWKKKEIISRWNVALLLYVPCVSAFAVSGFFSLIYYFHLYMLSIFFMCMSLVGFVTTFFTEADFLGIKSENKEMINKASIKFFLTVIGITIVTFIFPGNWSAMDLSILFVILNLLQKRWTRQATGEKSSWQIKW